MKTYCIIEKEEGLVIVEHDEKLTAEETAHQHGGTVADSGPYQSYEDAQEALLSLQQEMDEKQDISGVPGTHVMEERYETDD